MAKSIALPGPALGDLVLVRWDDIHTDHGWLAPDAELGVAECVTVGFVVGWTDRVVTLAATRGSADGEVEHNGRIAIPRGTVTLVTVLSLAADV